MGKSALWVALFLLVLPLQFVVAQEAEVSNAYAKVPAMYFREDSTTSMGQTAKECEAKCTAGNNGPTTVNFTKIMQQLLASSLTLVLHLQTRSASRSVQQLS